MYNEIIKKNYIDETGFQLVTVKYYFNSVASTEEKLGKDVYDFSVQDLINFYKSLCRSSYSTLRNFHYTFKTYTTWALSKQMVADNMNHSMEITPEILRSCVHKVRLDDQIISREELLDDLNGLPNPSDCFVILSLFEGVCSNTMVELRGLTMDYIDKEKKILTLKSNGRQIKISDELIDYAESSANEFLRYEQKCTDWGEYYYDLDNPKPKYNEEDVCIVKMQNNVDPYKDSDERFTRRTRGMFLRIQRVLYRAVYTPSAISHSGKIYYIKSIYDGSIPIWDFIRNNYQDIADRYGDFDIYDFYAYYRSYLEGNKGDE